MKIHFAEEQKYWKLSGFIGAHAILLTYFLLMFPSPSTGEIGIPGAIISAISYGGIIALFLIWLAAPYIREALGEQEKSVEKMLDYGTFFSGVYGSITVMALYDRFLDLPNVMIDTGASFAGFVLGFTIFWMVSNALIGRKLGVRKKFRKLFLVGQEER